MGTHESKCHSMERWLSAIRDTRMCSSWRLHDGRSAQGSTRSDSNEMKSCQKHGHYFIMINIHQVYFVSSMRPCHHRWRRHCMRVPSSDVSGVSTFARVTSLICRWRHTRRKARITIREAQKTATAARTMMIPWCARRTFLHVLCVRACVSNETLYIYCLFYG